jgi:diguanylate cyclase (GGDEF)-like protein
MEDFDRWATGLPEGEACALYDMDIDDFKPINDIYGHRLGDEVLKVVAKRLTQLAEGASVARLGGDEFDIILRYRLGSDTLERMARRIVHEVSQPMSACAWRSTTLARAIPACITCVSWTSTR